MSFFGFLASWLEGSWLELLGTISGLFCIYYEVKEKPLTWPAGIISSAIYAVFLSQDQLYGQALFQLITIPISLWGWTMWLRRDKKHQLMVKIHSLSRKGYVKLIFVTIIATTIAYSIELKYSQSAYIFVDSFSAVLGVIALCMLGAKIIEQWWLWIIADGVPGLIMLKQGHYPSAALFACYTALAVVGYYNWYRLKNGRN